MGSKYFPKGNAAFTLIELLVVVAIVGILAGTVVIALNPAQQIAKGRDAQRKNDLAQIRVGLDAYYNDNNKYPAQMSDLVSSYMPKLPQDPIGSQSYCYEISSGGSVYRLSAKLEVSSDPQATSYDIICAANKYNYAVTSTNTSVVVFGGVSTPTPFPTPTPTATPIPSPTSTPTPTPKPAQTPVKTNYSVTGTTGGTFTLGYRFKANVSGTVTGLWDRTTGGTKTLKLWSDSGTLLRSVVVTGINGSWVEGAISSYAITPGTYYRVSTYTPTSFAGNYFRPMSYPVTKGDIIIDASYYYSGDGFPNIRDMGYLYGLTDITFIPD